jgi:ABC-type sulfate transport system permease component
MGNDLLVCGGRSADIVRSRTQAKEFVCLLLSTPITLPPSSAGLFLDLLFRTEDGSGKFLRNFGLLSNPEGNIFILYLF